MPCVDPRFLNEGIRIINTPYFYDPLSSISNLIFKRTSTSDEVLVCMHDMSIIIQAGMLLLSFLNTFTVQIV